LAALVLLLLTAAGAFALWQRAQPTTVVLPAMNSGVREEPEIDEPLCEPPAARAQLTPENRLLEWTIVLTDPERQSVTTETLNEDDRDAIETTVFRIRSEALVPIRILSRPVNAQKGMRFTARAQFKRLQLEEGFVEVALVEKLAAESERLLINRQPRNLSSAERWLPTSATMERGLESEGEVQYVLQGEFIGEIMIRKNEFFRRE
jgi:hypothetical protein